MTAPVRDAATVVVVRDATEGLEVLLLRRTDRAAFVPGALVFPRVTVAREVPANQIPERDRDEIVACGWWRPDAAPHEREVSVA